jgi:hypothetical protein
MNGRYAEVQVTSHFSFLRGASSCEELFAHAALLGIEALAVADRNTSRRRHIRAGLSDRPGGLLPALPPVVRGQEARRKPGDEKKDVVWFALNEDRPLFAFAGIWTEYKGDRGTKSKPIPGPHCVYGFLTTSPSSNRYTPKRCW